jgi:carnitine 3-dehydrogenase
MGQSLLWHLGGGQGGIQHFMEHLMPPLLSMWKSLGNPEWTPELRQTVIDGVLKEAGDRSIDQIGAERDEMLLGLLKVRSKFDRS